jgi:hypothetical protein
MNKEEEEKEKYLASQKRRIERAEKDGWTNIRAVYLRYGDFGYCGENETFELRGISPDCHFDYVPKYPLQRLIISDGYTYVMPIFFESKEKAELLFLATRIEKDKEYRENEKRMENGGDYRFVDTRFELFGIEFDIHSDPKFYTLDEWYANAYSPESSEKSP